MALQNKIPNQNHKIRVLTLLVSMAVTANIFEILLPSIPFLPWIKIGLANIFVINALIIYGFREAFIVALLKTLLSAFLCGLPITTILLSGSGGLSSAIAMSFLWLAFGKNRKIGMCGLGAAGAFIHNLMQLFVANALFLQNSLIYWQLPFMAFLSIITGSITGILSSFFLKFILELPDKKEELLIHTLKSFPKKTELLLFVFFLASIIILLINSLFLLVLIDLTMLLGLVFIKISIKKILLAVVRFWALFLFNASLNLFFTYGTFYEAFPLITHEGVHKTTFLTLRLLGCILLSLIILNQNNIRVIAYPISKILKDNGSVSTVTINSIKIIPDIISMAVSLIKPVAVYKEGGILRIRQGLAGAVQYVWSRID